MGYSNGNGKKSPCGEPKLNDEACCCEQQQQAEECAMRLKITIDRCCRPSTDCQSDDAGKSEGGPDGESSGEYSVSPQRTR